MKAAGVPVKKFQKTQMKILAWTRSPLVLTAMISALLFHAAPVQAEPLPLPQLAAQNDGVSVSGFSSGAYMAGQFQLAHSKKVVGAAIIAGGPYGCGKSAFSSFTFGFGRQMVNLSKAINGCMLNLYAIWGVPNAERLARRAERLAEAGKIDALSHLSDDKVYLFSGKQDRTVVPAIVDAAGQILRKLGISKAHIKRVSRFPAGHAFVTEDSGNACELTGKPFVVDCDYDQAGDLLGHIYGTLKPRSLKPTGRYVVFDQRPFTDNQRVHGMSDEGVVYVPQQCHDQSGCRVHIAFHGCAQNRDQVNDAFVHGTGFARWADNNQLIILYPQIKAGLGNTQACWDWWGYTGRDFLTRDAAQISSVNRMLEHLTGARSGGVTGNTSSN